MAVPLGRNSSVTVVEKLSKYKDLWIEIGRMWKMVHSGSLRRGWKSTLRATKHYFSGNNGDWTGKSDQRMQYNLCINKYHSPFNE